MYYEYNQAFINAFRKVQRGLGCSLIPDDTTGEIVFRFPDEITWQEMELMIKLCYDKRFRRRYRIVHGNTCRYIDFVVDRAKMG